MDMERLDRVLRRVRGEEITACPLSGDRELLTRLIRGEEVSMRRYGQLRQQCSGQPRVQLTRLWLEEERHHRDLQAEYLARCGDTLPTVPEKSPAGKKPLTAEIGRLREQELAAAEEYRRCARETADHRLELLFEKHAREEEQHAQMLTELLRRSMR